MVGWPTALWSDALTRRITMRMVDRPTDNNVSRADPRSLGRETSVQPETLSMNVPPSSRAGDGGTPMHGIAVCGHEARKNT
eukprot:607036-Karenia_brevis.AAC.1